MNREGEYQEFNISPSGAWWSCTFSSYRQRTSGPVTLTPFVVKTDVTANGWSVLFGVSLKDLVGPLFPAETRIHVSAIVTVDGERRYLSSAPVAGIDPDFHHSGCFTPMALVHESK